MEQENILFTLALTFKEIQRTFKRFANDLSMDTPIESVGILVAVYYKSDLIQQEIADIVKKDKSAVLRHIDSLEKKGLLQRTPASNDRRRNVITLTEQGKRFVEEVSSKANELFTLLSEGLTVSEVAALHALLKHLQRNARKI